MNTFEKFYGAGIQELISKHYRSIRRVFVWCAAVSVSLVISALIFDIPILFVIAAVTVFFAVLQSARMSARLSGRLLEKTLRFIAEDQESGFVLRPNTILDDETFGKIQLFKITKYSRTGSNFTKMMYKKAHPVTFFDFALWNWRWEDQKWEKDYIFKGFVLSLCFQKEIKQNIHLMPKGVWGRAFSVSGKKINLENAELSDNYTVYCKDEIESRKILTLSFMEKINALNEIFPTKKYLSFREDDMLTIFIEGFTIGKLRHLAMPVFKNDAKIRQTLHETWCKVENIFKIIEVLGIEDNRKKGVANDGRRV